MNSEPRNALLLQQAFDRFKPWQSGFEIEGQYYGNENYFPLTDPRIDLFMKKFPGCRRVLEIGCLEGGHTVRMQQLGVEQVTAIEGRESNITKSTFICDVFGYPNTKFILGNIDTFDFTSIGRFDAVLCIGVLYHLANPLRFLEQIHHASGNLFLWTHFEEKVSSYREEKDLDSPTAAITNKVLWLSESALGQALSKNTWQIIWSENQKHPNGPCATIAARKLTR